MNSLVCQKILSKVSSVSGAITFAMFCTDDRSLRRLGLCQDLLRIFSRFKPRTLWSTFDSGCVKQFFWCLRGVSVIIKLEKPDQFAYYDIVVLLNLSLTNWRSPRFEQLPLGRLGTSLHPPVSFLWLCPSLWNRTNWSLFPVSLTNGFLKATLPFSLDPLKSLHILHGKNFFQCILPQRSSLAF